MRRITPASGILSPIQRRDWLLLLNARNLPHIIVRINGYEHIFVPVLFENLTLHELALFSRENHPKSTRSRAWPPYPFWQFAPIYLLPLIYIHASFPASGYEVGALEGARLWFHGEWHRLITALFLHADWAHTVGNIFFGGIFLAILTRLCGIGHAWLLTLLAGILGNYLSALIHVASYRSVGFSTAVFGAVGLICGLHICRSYKQWSRPFAAAIAILAMLGTAGEHTDYGAHICGLGCGLILGGCEGYAIIRHIHLLPQWLAALLAWAIPFSAWHCIK